MRQFREDPQLFHCSLVYTRAGHGCFPGTHMGQTQPNQRSGLFLKDLHCCRTQSGVGTVILTCLDPVAHVE